MGTDLVADDGGGPGADDDVDVLETIGSLLARELTSVDLLQTKQDKTSRNET